jgi:hypothetical protein
MAGKIPDLMGNLPVITGKITAFCIGKASLGREKSHPHNL